MDEIFFEACDQGYYAVAEYIVDNHSIENLVDVVDQEGNTGIHIATIRGCTNILELLLKNKWPVNDEGAKKATPLHIAVQMGLKPCCEVLLRNGASLESKDEFGLTPLHWAEIDGNQELLDLMCDSIPASEEKTKELFDALQHKNEREVLSLLRRGTVDVRTVLDASGDSTLHWAARRGFFNVTFYLLQWRGVQVDWESTAGRTALHLATLNRHWEVARWMYDDAGADIVSKGRWGFVSMKVTNGHIRYLKEWVTDIEKLVLSCIEGNADLLATVLNACRIGACSTKRGKLALLVAAARNFPRVVTLLVTHGWPIDMVDSQGLTALHVAAKSGFLEVVRVLLKYGANTGVKDNDGETACDLAERNGYFEVVAQFDVQRAKEIARGKMKTACREQDVVAMLQLANSPYADVADDQSWPGACILGASCCGHLPTVLSLLRKGISANLPDSEGRTPLHLAALWGRLGVCEVLVSKGAQLDSKTKCGNLPIHMAAAVGHPEVVKYFLAKGVSINVRGERGRTALHQAAARGHSHLVPLLMSLGADPFAKDMQGRTASQLAGSDSEFTMLVEKETKRRAIPKVRLDSLMRSSKDTGNDARPAKRRRHK